MNSLFLCLFHTKYNSQILRACYIQFKIRHTKQSWDYKLATTLLGNKCVMDLICHPLFTLLKFSLKQNSFRGKESCSKAKNSRIKTPDRYLTKWQQVLNSQQTIQILPTAATNEV